MISSPRAKHGFWPYDIVWRAPPKNTLLIMMLALSPLVISCAGQAIDNDVDRHLLDTANDTIPFLGTWTREFEPAPGNPHVATYAVEPDGIRYTLVGNVANTDYVMARDAFVGDENRFVGHTEDGTYYVLFARDISDDSITLYKQEVDRLSDGLSLTVPPQDTTESHGWNQYSNR